MEKTDVRIVKVDTDTIHELIVKAQNLDYKANKEGVKKPGKYCILGYQGINFTLDSEHQFVKDLLNQDVMTATLELFKDEDDKQRADYAGHVTYAGAVKRAEAQAKVAKAGAVLKAIEAATLTPESVQAILSSSAGF